MYKKKFSFGKVHQNALIILSIHNFSHATFGHVFISMFIQNKKKNCGTKVFKIFFCGSLSKRFKNFEYPQFRRDCAGICYFSLYTDNKILIIKVLSFRFSAVQLSNIFFYCRIQKMKQICGPKSLVRPFCPRFYYNI